MSIAHGHQLFGAVGAGSDKDQQAGTIGCQAHVEVDAIGPQVDVLLVVQIALFPLPMIGLPLAEQALDVGGRESASLFTEDRLEGRNHLGHGNTLEIECWDQVVQSRHSSQVGRQDGAGELMISPFVAYPRLLDLDRTQPGLDPPCRQVAIADDQAMTLVIALLPMLVEVIGHFLFNGPLQHLLSPLAEGLFE